MSVINIPYLFPFSYAYNSEVGTYTPTPYYANTTQVHQGNSMGYDISADYVDSTTTYDPRPSLDALSDTGSLMANVVTTGKREPPSLR